MVKSFLVRPGHFAQCDGLWYEPGILLVVAPQDRVEVFVNRNGNPAACIGTYSFAQLNEQAPPFGLLSLGAPADSRSQRRVRVAA
jgi:hypothetical protein